MAKFGFLLTRISLCPYTGKMYQLKSLFYAVDKLILVQHAVLFHYFFQLFEEREIDQSILGRKVRYITSAVKFLQL